MKRLSSTLDQPLPEKPCRLNLSGNDSWGVSVEQNCPGLEPCDQPQKPSRARARASPTVNLRALIRIFAAAPRVSGLKHK